MHQNASCFRIYSMGGIELKNELRKKILTSIKQEEIRRARVYVFTGLTAFMASSFGVVFTFKYMFQGFYQSSFYSYFSLFFSDPDIAFSYWKELSLSLVESAPLLGITFSLTMLGILLTSIRMLANNTKQNLALSFNN